MNTSFANQLVGYIVENGTFDFDQTSPAFDGFVIRQGDLYMKVWMPREGWFHCAVTIGQPDNGVKYHFTVSSVNIGISNYYDVYETLDIATPTDWDDYELSKICHNRYQKYS